MTVKPHVFFHAHPVFSPRRIVGIVIGLKGIPNCERKRCPVAPLPIVGTLKLLAGRIKFVFWLAARGLAAAPDPGLCAPRDAMQYPMLFLRDHRCQIHSSLLRLRVVPLPRVLRGIEKVILLLHTTARSVYEAANTKHMLTVPLQEWWHSPTPPFPGELHH